MFFALVLHRDLGNFDLKDQFRGSDNKRKYTYKRMDRCTILLRRFIQKMKILRVLFESYGISRLVLIAGHYKGFFRIPQVKSFLNIASRKLHNADISRIPEVVNQELQHTLPLLEAIGRSIVDLHKLEADIDYEEGRRYPTIPSLIRSPHHILPSHPLSLTARIPGSADESKTFGSAPLSSTPLATLPRSSSSSPSLAAVSPIITELVRFIEVSALPAPADSLNGLQPHERAYRLLLEEDPEQFSCFREQNPTYRRILTTLEEQSRTRDPLFLARWMMWRVYAWGLEAVQDRFGALKSGRDVFSARENISKRDGNDAIKVKTYGAQFGLNVPSDVQKINKIWNAGLEIWADWQERLPVSFASAQESIASTGIPIYNNGTLSQLLLYGDMARLGIVVSPTVGEMATVIVKGDRGAMRGLEILGWKGQVIAVEEGLEMLHRTLNTLLSPAVKALFHGGEVGLFDIEHALCKVARKQGNMRTKSPDWPNPMTKKERVTQRKRGIEEVEHELQIDGLRKRQKVS
jgi:hypothetical protein